MKTLRSFCIVLLPVVVILWVNGCAKDSPTSTPTPPLAPTNLIATVKNSTSIDLK